MKCEAYVILLKSPTPRGVQIFGFMCMNRLYALSDDELIELLRLTATAVEIDE